MISENNHPEKPLRLLVVAIALLLLIVSSTIFVAVKVQGSQGNASAHHPALTATATRPITPSPSLTPQPLFSDNFSDNSKGWYTGKVADYTRTISDDALTLSATDHKILVESLPSDATFDDFMLTTTFTLQQADEHDSVGLYLRGDSNLDHDYRIDIFGNATYAISKESLDEHNNQIITPLAGPAHSSSLKPAGQQNTLKVIMKESTLVLMMNGTVVNTVTDTDYTRGQIALFVENGETSDGVTASFSDIEIYPAPDQLPG